MPFAIYQSRLKANPASFLWHNCNIFSSFATRLSVFSAYCLEEHFIMCSICTMNLCKVTETRSMVDMVEGIV